MYAFITLTLGPYKCISITLIFSRFIRRLLKKMVAHLMVTRKKGVIKGIMHSQAYLKMQDLR